MFGRRYYKKSYTGPIPLGWKFLGLCIIALSLALGFYLKLKWVNDYENKVRKESHMSVQEQQHNADQLNHAVQPLSDPSSPFPAH